MTTPTAPAQHAAAAPCVEPLPRFIQCRSPAARYEWLRRHALHTRRSINSVVLEAVVAYRADPDASGGVPGPGQPMRDGERQVMYNVRLDDDLYTWLRTTAFSARVSINSLIGAALACASADQAVALDA